MGGGERSGGGGDVVDAGKLRTHDPREVVRGAFDCAQPPGAFFLRQRGPETLAGEDQHQQLVRRRAGPFLRRFFPASVGLLLPQKPVGDRPGGLQVPGLPGLPMQPRERPDCLRRPRVQDLAVRATQGAGVGGGARRDLECLQRGHQFSEGPTVFLTKGDRAAGGWVGAGRSGGKRGGQQQRGGRRT
jgi:hypothetical protein